MPLLSHRVGVTDISNQSYFTAPIGNVRVRSEDRATTSINTEEPSNLHPQSFWAIPKESRLVSDRENVEDNSLVSH